jgi:hypothetical protein
MPYQNSRPAQPAQPAQEKRGANYTAQVANDGTELTAVNIKGAWYAQVDERVRIAHLAERGGFSMLEPAVYPLDIVLPSGERVQRWFYRAGLIYQGRTYYGTAEIDWNAPRSSPAEAENPLECAETSALGRALAAANVGVLPKGRASAEEVRKSERKSEARASAQPAQAAAPAQPAGARPVAQPARPAQPAPEETPVVGQRVAQAGWGVPAGLTQPAQPASAPQSSRPVKPEPGADGHYSMMLAFEHAKAAGIKGTAWGKLRGECGNDADSIIQAIEDILDLREPGDDGDITFSVDEELEPAGVN